MQDNVNKDFLRPFWCHCCVYASYVMWCSDAIMHVICSGAEDRSFNKIMLTTVSRGQQGAACRKSVFIGLKDGHTWAKAVWYKNLSIKVICFATEWPLSHLAWQRFQENGLYNNKMLHDTVSLLEEILDFSMRYLSTISNAKACSRWSKQVWNMLQIWQTLKENRWLIRFHMHMILSLDEAVEKVNGVRMRLKKDEETLLLPVCSCC